jgi:hypothetical protein
MWPLREISEEDRILDLEAALAFGNHKGALKQPGLLKELCMKDVKHAYALPLPLKMIRQIPGLHLAPVNIAAQNTIDEQGRIIPKDRLTHDQSFTYSDGSRTSVNNRVIVEELSPCMFGGCFRRMINWVAAARSKYPGRRIVMSKIDFKSAYRRMHINMEIARQTCTHLPEEGLVLMALRLTFGGAPCPSEWGEVSETICDLANAILADPNWNPRLLCSPNQGLVPEEPSLSDDVPFADARPLFVDIPVNPRGHNEVFIDDNCTLGVDLPGTDNVLCVESAAMLAIHTFARPRHKDEPIPREWMEALNKLAAEAGATEIKLTLGWNLNLRLLIVALPDNKAIAWIAELEIMLNKKKATAKQLEQNIGRYVNVAMIIPWLHHFLGRLRKLHERALNRRAISVPPSCIEDLELIRKLIRKANTGIDLNLLTYRMPTYVHRGDSCPIGMGGYNHWGFAWRFYIPLDLQNRATNNLLEHLAAIIGVWIDILAGRLRPGDCCLSQTDSTTTAGWLKKSNFNSDPELDPTAPDHNIQAAVREEVCRKHATLLLESELCEFANWIPGEANPVSDSFSRDDNVPDSDLTKLLCEKYPKQVPADLKIVPLPKEISSWLTSALRKLPVRTQSQERHTRTTIGRGYDGALGLSQSASLTTTSSTTSPDHKESDSSAALPQLSDKEGFLRVLMRPWLQEQSKMPLAHWYRPSGTMIESILQETRTEKLVDFYNSKKEHTQTKTHLQSNKRPCPAASSRNSPDSMQPKSNKPLPNLQ